MKVLFVSSGNSKDGISPLVYNQGESLKKSGIILDYFTIEGTGVTGYLSNLLRLRKHIKKNNFDIIHAHYTYSGLLCLLSFIRKPIVLSVMGCDAYGDFDFNGKRLPSYYLIMLLTQIIQPFMKTIIVKSNNINKYIYLKKKSYLVPNGVNFNLFKPKDSLSSRKKLNLPADKKIVFFLADSEDPRKNYKLMKQASGLFTKKDIEVINPYPINNKIVPDYLNACDVFVLTSFNEGSPNVIKEAMACNCPVVSTDVGDVKEVISGTDGCYLTSFDPKDVADKIENALTFNKRTNGRENIKHLEASVIADKIINIYKRLILN
ncbi:MAG: glycosyltransferase [Bacteroidales bacterium]|nr:glycosyltransferase [Bacteroidales bacterium]